MATNPQPSQALLDYQRIEKALHFIEANFQQQPALKDIAEAANLSEFHFDRLFSRWAGTSPQRFMRFLTKEYAKELLSQTPDLLDVMIQSGLSSPSRLHDLFVTYEAMTPTEYKKAGEGLTIEYGIAESPFGFVFMAFTNRGILDLVFLTENDSNEALNNLQKEFPKATFQKNNDSVLGFVNQIFSEEESKNKQIQLLLRGTNFQIKVWEALLKVPSGQMVCYETIAALIGKPTAQRAVGTAIGSNHVAYLIPCHRVIQKMGTTGNYRWGGLRKKAILGWEAGHLA